MKLRPIASIILGSVAVATLAAQAQAVETVAHRGYGDATGASYRAAAKTGATLEADLQLTRDNKIVISHDAVSHGCGKKIKSMTRKQLAKCDPQIISVETLLSIGRDYGTDVSLEPKSNGGKAWTNYKLKKLIKIIRSYRMENRTQVYSFEAETIAKWRKVSNTKTGLNVNKRSGLDIAKIKKAGGRVAVKLQIVNAADVQRLHNAGIHVSIYTTHNEAEVQKALSLKPDAIITDVPL